MAMWDGRMPSQRRQQDADDKNMNEYLKIADRYAAKNLFPVFAASADKVVEQMSEQQNEVPAWARGEGWEWQKSYKLARTQSGRIRMSIIHTGRLHLTDQTDETIRLHYATPEKARQVADAILDGLL